MICLNNWVYIVPDKINPTIKGLFRGEKRIEQHGNERVAEYDVKEPISYSGIVQAVPQVVVFHGDRIKELLSIRFENRSQIERNELHELQKVSAKFNVPVEIQVGDRVFFTMSAIRNKMFEQGFVRYDECVMRERNGEYYPLNGALLIEPCEKNKYFDTKGLLLNVSERKTELNKSKVLKKGVLVSAYKDIYETDVDEINEGNIIYHDATCGFPIEDKDFKIADKWYHYVHRKDILYYE